MKRVVPTVRLSVLCLLLTIFSTRANSQSISSGDGAWEAGLSFGPMFFLGDLGGSAGIGKPFVKDLDFPLTNLSKTLYGAYYHPSGLVGLRLAFNHGVLKGDDAKAPNKGGAEVDRLLRNLSFKSSVLEAQLLLEIYPTVIFEQYEEMQGKLRPYIVGGIGAMKFNPKAKDPATGQWVKLQPLRLEGEGMAEYPNSKPYKLTQMTLPFGGGIKYWVKENMYVGIELLHRVTFTDKLDNVSAPYYVDPALFNTYLSSADAAVASRMYYRGLYAVNPATSSQQIQGFQRGDPTENDAFFSTSVRIGWTLNTYGDKMSRRQLRCPVFY
jgi:hypothetical protein